MDQQFRVIRLLPGQLKAVWDLVRYGVARSIPAHVKASQETVRGVLKSLLADRAQCWVMYREAEDGGKEMHALLISAMEIERISGGKFLNLWAMYAYRSTPLEGWQVMRQTVETFAREQGCHCVSTMTSNPKAAELAMGLGAIQTTFLSKEV